MSVLCDTLLECLPLELKAQTLSLLSNSEAKRTLDDVLRFALCFPKWAANVSEPEWEKSQGSWRNKLEQLVASDGGPANLKRPLDYDFPAHKIYKKPRTDATILPTASGNPLFTLHGISCTAPLRKKLDITITTTSISFLNPSSGTTEAHISIEDLNRAFLLPTPGKSKPYFTLVMMGQKRSDPVKAEISEEHNQIVFGIDATTTGPYKTTSHTPSSNTTTHPKNTATLPLLLEFISQFPQNFLFLDASRSSFRSAINKEECGVTAYLRAKEGHVYFFKEGLLWGEKKPCMWFGVDEIKNVRVGSATGKTASLYVEKNPENDDDEGETIEFSMLDGREMEPIRGWVRSAESRFGRVGNPKNPPDVEVIRKNKGKSKEQVDPEQHFNEAQETNGDVTLDDDESDGEFKVESDAESDGGEPSSNSSASSEGEEEREAEDEADDPNDDPEGSNDGRRDNHKQIPRPRVSGAALEMALGMLKQDLKAKDEEDELASDDHMSN